MDHDRNSILRGYDTPKLYLRKLSDQTYEPLKVQES